jgi:hypothetical protein
MSRNWIVALGVLSLVPVGCASSVKLENQSRIHRLRADTAAERRQYDVAAREQDEADRLHDKAIKRARKEGNAAAVTVPADVPYPTPPSSPPPPQQY